MYFYAYGIFRRWSTGLYETILCINIVLRALTTNLFCMLIFLTEYIHVLTLSLFPLFRSQLRQVQVRRARSFLELLLAALSLLMLTELGCF